MPQFIVRGVGIGTHRERNLYFEAPDEATARQMAIAGGTAPMCCQEQHAATKKRFEPALRYNPQAHLAQESYHLVDTHLHRKAHRAFRLGAGCHVIAFDYQTPQDAKPRLRFAQVYRLVTEENQLALFCREVYSLNEDDCWRTFRLDEISRMRNTDISFSPLIPVEPSHRHPMDDLEFREMRQELEIGNSRQAA